MSSNSSEPTSQSAIEQLEVTGQSTDAHLVGIGGWLVLPAFGLVFGPVVGTIMLIVALGLYPGVAAAGFGGLYGLELAVQAGLIALLCYTAVQFFGRKRKAPGAVIMTTIVSLTSSVGLLVIELAAGADDFAIESGKQIIRESIAAAIWIPYFLKSKRVRATFTR